MKVWVDCTAAAHPLVLRPIIERLRGARATRSSSPRASTGRPRACSSGSGSRITSVGSHARRLARSQGRGRSPARSARLAGFVWGRRPDLAIAHGSVDLAVVSVALPDPVGADAGLRVRRAAAPGGFRVARRVLVPDAIPLERLAQVGAKERSWSATRA